MCAGTHSRLPAPPAPRYELGRVPGNTKLVTSSTSVAVRRIRVRGGHFKFRALRLDAGNFAWPSESVTKKVRVLDVTYNASNNELVRPRPGEAARWAGSRALRVLALGLCCLPA
jgi:ribosomal protein S8E